MVNGYKPYTQPDYPYSRLNLKILVVSNDVNWLILHGDMPETPQVTPQVAGSLKGYKNYGETVHNAKGGNSFI